MVLDINFYSTCAGSESTENNWWSIDMEDNFDIHEVVIYGPAEIDGATVRNLLTFTNFSCMQNNRIIFSR